MVCCGLPSGKPFCFLHQRHQHIAEGLAIKTISSVRRFGVGGVSADLFWKCPGWEEGVNIDPCQMLVITHLSLATLRERCSDGDKGT
jgi:hypothetical protein